MTVEELKAQLRLPLIGAPMFIVSTPELVIAQCASGVLGAFPALNARPQAQLGDWLGRITAALDALRREHPERAIAPFAVNQIVHPSNPRLEQDIDTCAEHRVPLMITSLHAPDRVVEAAHAYGGLVFHDVTTVRHAKRALDAGVDGLILVCAGAGGHAGRLSPFALAGEVRRFYDGPIALAGAISHGEHLLAAQALGADFGYLGTRFIASLEANASVRYRQMLIEAGASEVIYTDLFTGIHGNYLAASIRDAGLDPSALPASNGEKLTLGDGGLKVWRDVVGAGQGVGAIEAIEPVARIVGRIEREYRDARRRLLGSVSG